MACTDLLCPEGVLRENRKSMELAMTVPADSPLCMQLYGGNVELLCEAARWAEGARGAHVIDINMGCPGRQNHQGRRTAEANCFAIRIGRCGWLSGLCRYFGGRR